MDPVISGYVLSAIAGLAGGGLIAVAGGGGGGGRPGPDDDVPKRPWPKCFWCPAFAGLLAAVIIWAVFGRIDEMAIDLGTVSVLGLVAGMAGGTVSRIVTER